MRITGWWLAGGGTLLALACGGARPAAVAPSPITTGTATAPDGPGGAAGTGAAAPGATTPQGPRLPRDAGIILYLGLELPDAGASIGGQYGGQAFDVRQNSFRLTESVRAGWSRAARLRGESVLHGAGYQVSAVGGPSSDVLAVDDDVRFGLQGRVHNLDIRTRAGQPHADARVEVSWELLDMGRGSVIFGRTVDGTVRGAETLEDATFDVFDDALTRLLADTAFLRVLHTPLAPGDLAVGGASEMLVGGREMIQITPDDLNPASDSSPVARLAAGVVTLKSQDQSIGTAFVLTRSGLALTTQRGPREVRRLRVRLASGVIRPARVIRSHGGLNVALIQIRCPEACQTVDWTVARPVVNASVLTMGAPSQDGEVPVVSRAQVGGQWGIAAGVTLDTHGEEVVNGGEPVALASNGQVVGMVFARPGRRTALLLGEILRALRVAPPPRGS